MKCTGRRDILRISQLAISICLLKLFEEIAGPLNPMKIRTDKIVQPIKVIATRRCKTEDGKRELTPKFIHCDLHR